MVTSSRPPDMSEQLTPVAVRVAREMTAERQAHMQIPQGIWRSVRRVLPVASVLVFLLTWQLVGERTNPILLSTPTSVAQAFGKMWSQGILVPAFLHAMAVLGTGLGLAAVIGVALGVLMGRSATFYSVFSPYVAFFQATPLVALVPLMVIWFGIGFSAEVAVTFMLGIWSIIINTTEGVRNTPTTLLDMARLYHVKERSVVLHIALPNALPYIFAGFRIALAKGLIGVIIAEMDVTLKGLGGLAENYGSSFQTAFLLATIITSSCVGVIGAIILDLLRRRVAPWAAKSDVERKV